MESKYVLASMILDGDYLPDSYQTVQIVSSIDTMIDIARKAFVRLIASTTVIEDDHRMIGKKYGESWLKIPNSKVSSLELFDEDEDQEYIFNIDREKLTIEVTHNQADNINRYASKSWQLIEIR